MKKIGIFVVMLCLFSCHHSQTTTPEKETNRTELKQIVDAIESIIKEVELNLAQTNEGKANENKIQFSSATMELSRIVSTESGGTFKFFVDLSKTNYIEDTATLTIELDPQIKEAEAKKVFEFFKENRRTNSSPSLDDVEVKNLVAGLSGGIKLYTTAKQVDEKKASTEASLIINALNAANASDLSIKKVTLVMKILNKDVGVAGFTLKLLDDELEAGNTKTQTNTASQTVTMIFSKPEEDEKPTVVCCANQQGP